MGHAKNAPEISFNEITMLEERVEDFLSPEQRVDLIAEVLATAALRLARRQATLDQLSEDQL